MASLLVLYETKHHSTNRTIEKSAHATLNPMKDINAMTDREFEHHENQLQNIWKLANTIVKIVATLIVAFGTPLIEMLIQLLKLTLNLP